MQSFKKLGRKDLFVAKVLDKQGGSEKLVKEVSKVWWAE